MTTGKNRPSLSPDAPGLDEETRRRRRVLARMRRMTPQEFRAAAIRAGIYTEEGELTEPYRSGEPSACRP